MRQSKIRKRIKKMNYHHRKPRAQRGKGGANLSHVDAQKHRWWHCLFSGERSVHSIVREINDTWIDPEYILVVEKRR